MNISSSVGFEGECRAIAAYTTKNRNIEHLVIDQNVISKVTTGYSEVVGVTGNVHYYNITNNI